MITEYEVDGELYVALEEHIVEMVLLTNRLNDVKAALACVRKREESRNRSANRQARWDADYVPYGDDERD